MTIDQLVEGIKSRAGSYSRNNTSHYFFEEEANGFFDGVNWTILKLYQLGYIRMEDKNDEIRT